LKELMETRDKLRDLLTKVDRSDDLENLLERILKSNDDLKQIQTQLGTGGQSGTPGGEA